MPETQMVSRGQAVTLVHLSPSQDHRPGALGLLSTLFAKNILHQKMYPEEARADVCSLSNRLGPACDRCALHCPLPPDRWGPGGPAWEALLVGDNASKLTLGHSNFISPCPRNFLFVWSPAPKTPGTPCH